MDLDAALALNRTRVDAFIAAARAQGASWTTPVRPDKWSPGQVAEHIAISYREAGRVFTGGADAFPRLPFFLRPLLRRFVFDKVLRSAGDFGRPVKTFRKLVPLTPAPNPDEAARRIEQSLREFEANVRAAPGPTIKHSAFGTIGAADYVTFQAYHTSHHQKQLSRQERTPA